MVKEIKALKKVEGDIIKLLIYDAYASGDPATMLSDYSDWKQVEYPGVIADIVSECHPFKTLEFIYILNNKLVSMKAESFEIINVADEYAKVAIDYSSMEIDDEIKQDLNKAVMARLSSELKFNCEIRPFSNKAELAEYDPKITILLTNGIYGSYCLWNSASQQMIGTVSILKK